MSEAEKEVILEASVIQDVVNGSEKKETSEKPKPPEMTIDEAQEKLKVISKMVKPSSEDFNSEHAVLNDEIKALRDKADDLIAKIDEAKQTRQGSKSEFLEAVAAFNNLKTEKEVCYRAFEEAKSKKNAARQEHDAIKTKRQQIQTKVKYNSIDEVDVAIKKLEKKQQTETMTLNEEKSLLKEIKDLKDSKTIVSQLHDQGAGLKSVQESLYSLREIEAEKFKAYQEINEKYKSQKLVVDNFRAQLDEIPDPTLDLITERNKILAEIATKMEKRNQLEIEFNKAMHSFAKSQNERKYLRNFIKRKEIEMRNAAFMERKRLEEEEEAKKIPYEEEMALCDQLIAHLTNSFKVKASKKESAPETNICAPEKDDFDGKFLVIKKKEKEEFYSMKKTKKGKSNRKMNVDGDGHKKNGPGGKNDTIVHGIALLENFAMLGLSAPNLKSEVDKSIEEVKAKKEWYSKQPRGSVPKIADTFTNNPKKTVSNERPKSKKVELEISDELFPLLPRQVNKSIAEENGEPLTSDLNNPGENFVDDQRHASDSMKENPKVNEFEVPDWSKFGKSEGNTTPNIEQS